MRAGAALASLRLILAALVALIAVAAITALWPAAGPGVGAALAQPTKSASKASAAAPTRPTWNQLTPAQRDALAPLSADWDTLDEPRKRKWLEVAPKYHQLSPEGQQHMHGRMREFSKLTPEQRWTARENFQRAYELPADQRNSLIQQYKDLPPERKQQLNEKARAKPEPARRAQSDAGRTAKDGAAKERTAKDRAKDPPGGQNTGK